MSILLVHGAWHGAWVWDEVLALLPDAKAIDLPSVSEGGGFADDVAAVRAAIDELPAPVVLCAHSYGGAVISEAGTHPSVRHLVFLCAFPLDVGETVMNNAAAQDPVASAAPPSALGPAIVVEGDSTVVESEGARVAFFADCDVQPVHRLRPQPMATFGVGITKAAWKSVPSTYVLCTKDQAIHPDVQRFFAERCTTTVELPASHSPMLSMPDRVAEILLGASD